MSDLLKEAIADAKAVRETALQNAKMALEEAFTPQLKSMLSAKLKEEEGVPFEEDEVGDGLDDEEVEPDIADPDETSIEGEADEEAPAIDEPSATAGESEESGVPGSQPETDYEENEVGDGESEEEVPAEGEELNQEGMYSEEEEEVPAEDDEVEEGALDLEAIIRELEDEAGEEEGGDFEEDEEMGGEEEVPAEEQEEVPAEEGSYEEDEEEELEVDENLWKEEEEEEEVEESNSVKLASELKEYKQAVKFLKDKLHEVNILNAKLLFTNKLFKEFVLNNNQKLKSLKHLTEHNQQERLNLFILHLLNNSLIMVQLAVKNQLKNQLVLELVQLSLKEKLFPNRLKLQTDSKNLLV